MFVVFKNCTTNDVVLELFKKQILVVRCLNKCFRRQKVKQEHQLFCGQELKIMQPLEPDEIIWSNLAHSKKAQSIRGHSLMLFSLLVLLFFALVAIYLSALNDELQGHIHGAHCPDQGFELNEDPDDAAYKAKVVEDFLKGDSETVHLIGCYCSRHSSWLAIWTLFTRKFNMAPAGEEPKTRLLCLE